MHTSLRVGLRTPRTYGGPSIVTATGQRQTPVASQLKAWFTLSAAFDACPRTRVTDGRPAVRAATLILNTDVAFKPVSGVTGDTAQRPFEGAEPITRACTVYAFTLIGDTATVDQTMTL